MQDAIRRTLKNARRGEPYPPAVSWEGIAKGVYRTSYAFADQIRNVQRAADRMYDVHGVYFTNGRKAGAHLSMNMEERWLKTRVATTCLACRYLSDTSSYAPPSKKDVLEVFVEGIRADVLGMVDLRKLTKIVNQFCGTSFDPSEVSWWRQGLVNDRAVQRREAVAAVHAAVVRLTRHRERLEREARMITVGPFRFDPDTAKVCPACHQDRPGRGFPQQQQGAAGQAITPLLVAGDREGERHAVR